jgi:hypothetical protein
MDKCCIKSVWNLSASFSFQAPAKKGDRCRSAEMIAAKLDMSLWLGESKHKHLCFESLPPGYEPFDGFESHPSEDASLPAVIRYTEKHVRARCSNKLANNCNQWAIRSCRPNQHDKNRDKFTADYCSKLGVQLWTECPRWTRMFNLLPTGFYRDGLRAHLLSCSTTSGHF